jgi:hypothetical protein
MKYVREYHGESRDGGVFQFSHRHQKNLKSRHSSLFLPSRENTKRINLGSLLTRSCVASLVTSRGAAPKRAQSRGVSTRATAGKNAGIDFEGTCFPHISASLIAHTDG